MTEVVTMWLFSWTLRLLCAVALTNGDDGEWREVGTAQGYVRGRRDPEGGLYTFYNIPYATVPLGDYKYSELLPGPVWVKPLDAVDKGIICMQPPNPLIDNKSKTMQENCLIANIYVPDTNEKDLPVLVYIHGGGFEIGFGDMMKPKNLVKKHKVIVVNFNYRLGVHGFLCLGTKTAPGNAGLKDQVALLRWVKKNIAKFGGNPDDVTIAGGSAGSMSAHLLMLSKFAEGYFNKVILESGATVGCIAIQIDPLENAKTYAKMLNFTEVDDFYALQDFYKNTPLDKLIINTFTDRKDASLLLAPCIERQTGSNVIIDDSPINKIKSGKYQKLPILIGFSNMEGLTNVPKLEEWKTIMNEDFSDFLPADLQFENEDEREKISKKVKEFYFGEKPVGEETVLGFVDYFSDVMFTYPTLRSVQLHMEAGHDQNIYLYEYNFVDDSTPVVPFTNVRGATHCAQTMAVLDGLTEEETDLSEEYKHVKSTIREIWYNFVVHGKPVPEGSSLPAWPAVSANRAPHMSLGNTLKPSGVLLEERTRFWDELYQKYYRHPIPPPQPPPEKHTELEHVGSVMSNTWLLRFLPRMIREAIEIKKHPNLNREDGWVLPPAWNPIIESIKSKS